MLDNCKVGAEVITSLQQYHLQAICYYHTIGVTFKGFIIKDYITRGILVKACQNFCIKNSKEVQ